jgi:hypothetical protein
MTRAVAASMIGLCLMATSGASAQTLAIGAGAGTSLQRFSDDPDLDRLNGTSAALLVSGSVLARSLIAQVEGAFDFSISDEEDTAVTVNGRDLTIRSTLEHDARSIALLGGYVFTPSGRLTIHALAGITSTGVTRTFTTNAGTLVLTAPSTLPPVTTQTNDRETTWSVGADVWLRQRNGVRVVAGVRAEPLSVPPAISGRRVRVLGGLAWASR